MEKNLKKGFTLIELLVVIAIIGILSSVVLVSLNSARQKARDAARKTNSQQVVTALSLYSDAFNTAVPGIVDCTAAPAWSGWVTSLASPDFVGCPKALAPTYLPRIISDTIAGTYGYRNDATTANTFCMVTVMEATGANPIMCDSSGCREQAGAVVTTCTEA